MNLVYCVVFMLEEGKLPAKLPEQLEVPESGANEDMSMKWRRIWKRRLAFLKQHRRSRVFLAGQFTRAKLLRNVTLGLLLCLVAGILGTSFLFAWYAKDLPQPDKVVRREGFSTKILDRNNELLYEVFSDQQRTPITIDQVSKTMREATIAIEDKEFYKHQGFDPFSILRIAKNIITKRRLIGGSTLTQQLVKNVLLTNERTLPRKIKEFILAVQIENKYSKDEILQMYLNEVPYGGPVWGVSTAARVIFDKQANDLNLVESAILAGIPQRPSLYSPIVGEPGAYVARTMGVLRRMREDGYITQAEESSAAAQIADYPIASSSAKFKAPHFVMYVKQQLIDMYGENLVELGGLKVTTTLNYPLQEAAQKIVSDEIAKVKDAGIGNGAAMVVDPKTGEIWSMVGSKDYFAKDYDGQVNVTLRPRQPGSAIKPVTYVTAFQKGYTPATVLMDVPTEFPGGNGKTYEPVNYDGKFRGPVQLRFALGSSLNIPAVKLLAMVGVQDMLQNAYAMGISTLEPTAENMQKFGLAVTLGGGDVRMIDLVSAYSAFANGGLKVEPVSILKVEDRNGKVLYEHKAVSGKRVLAEDDTFLINHILTDNNARLLTFGANSYLNFGNKAIAVKTGTTNDKKDNWTIGWSRGAMVGVWVGNNDNSSMKNVASGVTGASPIWRKIMLEVLKTVPDEPWPIPSSIEAVKVDLISGYPEHDGFPSRTEYVKKATLPSIADPIHTKLKLCRGQNKLASAVDVMRNEYEEKEFYVFKEDFVQIGVKSWQDKINEWTQTQPDEKYHPPTEYCDANTQIAVNLDAPSDRQNFSNNEVPVRIKVVAQQDINKVEIYVDGGLKDTLTERPYEITLVLESGKHTIKAKAYQNDGKTSESGEAHIGVGGVAWDYQEPSPTPLPTPTSILIPTETPKKND